MLTMAAAAVGLLLRFFLPRPPPAPAREGEWRRAEGNYIGSRGEALLGMLGFWLVWAFGLIVGPFDGPDEWGLCYVGFVLLGDLSCLAGPSGKLCTSHSMHDGGSEAKKKAMATAAAAEDKQFNRRRRPSRWRRRSRRRIRTCTMQALKVGVRMKFSIVLVNSRKNWDSP
jgi:hypothetical protein